ncbi:MAG TPA: toll/interleukin-1 receptor domain-containing protein [Bacteroidia bacterium]|nr:toll/interleukin-1 receptor domain-containing protein [Bacteroidia bacterium]
MKYNFPTIKINKDEKTWLAKVYEKLLSGDKIDRSIIRVELHKKISSNFDPSRIDSRLIKNYEDITLLGIYHVDQNSALIESTDKVLLYIKNLIINSPDKTSVITSNEISSELKIPMNYVSIVFKLIDDLGSFWKQKGIKAINGEQTSYLSVDEYSVFEDYLKYDGIEQVINNFYLKGNPKLKDEFIPVRKKKKTKSQKNKVSKIFISHASKDKKLVDEFVNQILILGLKVKEDDIFCTSIEGLDIETGEDFRNHIKEKLQDTRLVILLITPNYKESEMCLNEMGAAWALDRKIVPIIIEPINYENVGVLMKVKQIGKLNDSVFLDKLKDNEIEKLKLNFEKIKTARWSKFKSDFIDYVNQYTKALQSETPKINSAQADIISEIRHNFKIDNLLWARIIYELGVARFQWTTGQTLIKKTGIDQHHITEFINYKPDIILRTTKAASDIAIYRLTEQAKETFARVYKSFLSEEVFEGIFVNQNDPPLQPPDQQLNDHYFNAGNPIDLNKYDIELSIKTNKDYWRCGIRFSKDSFFNNGRHEVYPFYGIHKDKNFNGFRVFCYDEKNDMSILANSPAENQWINILTQTQNNTTNLSVPELRPSSRTINGYRYCQILAWADEHPFEMEYKIKLIKKYI